MLAISGFRTRLTRLRTYPHLPAAALLGGLVLVGIIWAPDYGPSWDESNTVPYGSETLDAYLRGISQHEQQGNLKYYGPAYFAATEAIVSLGGLLANDWLPLDLRHLIFFLSLPIAVASLYSIAARWFGTRSAFVASALFATQPLIFGHSFINPKDTPFLAFFLLTIALGACMADRIGEWKERPKRARESCSAAWLELPKQVRVQLGTSSLRTKVALLLAVVVPVLLALDLLKFRRFILPTVLSITRRAYDQTAWPITNRLFLRIAEHKSEVPLSAYTSKLEELYALLDVPIAAVLFVPAVALLVKLFRPTLLGYWPRDFAKVQTIAGVVLGLTTSIRVVAPFAGGLVSALVISKAGRRSLRPLIWYWAVAAAVAYFTWPFLWDAPVSRALAALRAMRAFETSGSVLFRGQVLPSTALPWYSLPWWWGIQLTLPAIALGALGLVLGIRQAASDRSSLIPIMLAVLWIGLPLGAAIGGSGSRYDNGRQYLFVLPPLFMSASMAIRHGLERIRSSGVKAVGLGLILLPGVMGILRLHPYEYVYYNSLVGGVRGAYRQYELDYWATSYREALETLNRSAEPGSRVFVYGPWEVVWQLARPDLELYDPPDDAFDRAAVDYLIVTTRANIDLQYRAWATEIARVQVDGVPLAYVLRNPESN